MADEENEGLMAVDGIDIEETMAGGDVDQDFNSGASLHQDSGESNVQLDFVDTIGSDEDIGAAPSAALASLRRQAQLVQIVRQVATFATAHMRIVVVLVAGHHRFQRMTKLLLLMALIGVWNPTIMPL